MSTSSSGSEVRRPKSPAREADAAAGIVGRSAAAHTLRERVQALAPLAVPVLIRGEPGSGRSHLARALYAAGPADRHGLVSIRCADAEAASRVPPARGVVLLDEVSALAPPAQARWGELVRRSEDGADGAPRRILASSARDLVSLAGDGRFDAGLARRLSRFTLDIPPLRERRQDVPDLARALADRAASRMGRPRPAFTREALRLLSAQSWPGNLRELDLLIERLVAFSGGGRISRSLVAALLAEAPAGVASSRRSASRRQREELAALIEAAGGNLAEVARRLDMSRGGVIYRAQKFGLLAKRGAMKRVAGAAQPAARRGSAERSS
jgi:two-component system response regulator HydG